MASSEVQMEWHLWWSVRMTPSLCCSGWQEANWRYWSVWVGFLYTENESFPSGPLVVRVSGIARDQSTSSSLVNCMLGSMLLMWWVRSSMSESQRATKVSSTYLFQKVIWKGKDWMACSSNHSMDIFLFRTFRLRRHLSLIEQICRRWC